MRRKLCIRFFVLSGVLVALMSCHSPQREAKRMVACAEALAETAPDSTARLIDSVLRMPVYFSERQRMEMALLQAEVLFREAPLEDDLFEDPAHRVATSPELERAAAYYIRKRQYGKAAHAALYSGYVQQYYNENENAMRSYKSAEQYGLLANDSFTAARAEYRIGKLLYYEGRKQEALSFFSVSKSHIGNRTADLSVIENGKGATHIMLSQFDSAEMCFQRSYLYAEESKSPIAKHKALNNFAVLYRLQGEYKKAGDCLQQIKHDTCLSLKEVFMSNLNIGNVFFDMNEMDSAASYYGIIESSLSSMAEYKETQLATYDALCKFAETQSNDSLALLYRERHEDVLYAIMLEHQEQSLFRIQKQYDYETMQNALNQKLMRRHRVTIVLGALAILGLIAFALSRIRVAKMRKQEAEAKTSLFHFMQQNKELLERQSEKETAYRELASENDTYKKAYQDYAERYSDAKTKELETIIKLAVYVNSKGEKAFLDTLKRTVFNAKSPWDAAIMAFDTLYPNVRENIDLQHPELTEMERKDFILSFIKVSRDEEAAMLETTIHTVDKLRNSVRKKYGKPKLIGEE